MNKNLNKSAYSLFARSKYDYAQEVQNLRCAFLCELSTRARAFFLTLVMAMTVLTVTGIAGMNVYAETGTVYVATYDQLREALEDTQGVKTIVVDPQAAADDGDVIYSVENDENSDAFYIGFDAPLTVSHDITITSADDVDVFFARSDSFRRDQGNPALFNIDRTGNLKLEGLITMTGEEVTTAYNDREFVFSIKSRDGTGDDNDAWNRGQVLKGGFYIQNNGGEYNLGDDVILEDFHTTDDVEGVEPIHEKETNSLFGAKKSDEETTTEEATEEKEEETVVAPAPKRLMKNALKSGTTTTKTVATYDQLKAALADNNVTKIIIDESGAGNDVEIKSTTSNSDKKFYLPVDAPLEINRAVEITATKDVIIARSNKYTSKDAIFKVTENGDLNLNGKITMTGDKVEYKYEFPPVVFGAANLFLGGNTFQLSMSSSANAIAFEFSNGLLIDTKSKQYLGGKNASLRLSNASGTVNDAIEVRDAETGAKLTTLSPGQKFVLYETYNDNIGGTGYYLKLNGTSFAKASNLKDAQVYTAGTASSGSNVSTKTTMEFNVENPKWTSDQVGKANGEYGGFFIDAPNGGTINIEDGVTICNLNTKCGFQLKYGEDTYDFSVDHDGYTEGSVYNLAPIYVGDNATLNVKGGEISNNTVGYGAEDAHSQSHVQNLKKWYNDSQPTNTAGAIIASGSNANVNITGNATITGNKADAGAIIATHGATVTMNANRAATNESDSSVVATDLRGISNNIGWHHAGAVLVEDDATFNLKDGSIHHNVAWLKGGAVWATEFGTKGLVRWDNYPKTMHNDQETGRYENGGNFVMENGHIDSNFSFVRAGAIEVESNGVELQSGLISNNMCKSLGGAIYIEGDSNLYTYTLNIESGYIHHNTAVDSAPDTLLDKKLDKGSLAPGNDYGSGGGRHKDKDWADWGMHQSGDGGGVWLCSMGGTSVFTANGSDQVVINNNTASNKWTTSGEGYSAYEETATDNGWGNDFYISRRYGSALVQNLVGKWYGDDEVYIDTIDDKGKVIKGPKGMYNSSTDAVGSGIEIKNNRSRNGGGIAANGTIIMGKAASVYRYEAELDIKKAWSGVAETAVTLKLYYEYDEDKNGKISDDEVFPLIQEGQTSESNESKKYYEVVLWDNNNVPKPNGNEVIYKTGIDTAKAFVPATVTHTKKDGTKVEVPLYGIKNDQNGIKIVKGLAEKYIDTTNNNHLKALFTYVNTYDSENAPLDIDWFVVIKEKGDGYVTTLENDENATAATSVPQTVGLVNPDNGEPINAGSFSVNFTTVKYGQKLTNSLQSVELTKVRAGDDTPIKGTKFILVEAKVDKNSDDIHVAGSVGEFNGVTDADQIKTILDVARKDENGNLKVYETNAQGKFAIDKLKPGKKYLLFEYLPRAGYEMVTSPWILDVTPEKVSVLAIDPQAKYDDGRSVLNKVKRRRGGDKLQDFTYVDNSDKANTTDATNNVWRTYWPGAWFYNMSGTTFGKPKNEVTDNKLSNNVADLQITKNGTDGKPVQGAKFVFFDTDYKNGDKTTITYGQNGRIAEVIDTDANGTIDLTKIIKKLREEGNNGVGQGRLLDTENRSLWLLMFEASVPDGYKQKTTPWLVNITNEGTVKIYEHSNPYKYSRSPLKENGAWNAAPPATEGGTDLRLSDYNASGLSGTPKSTGTISANAEIKNETVIEITKVNSMDSSKPVVGAKFVLNKVSVSDGGGEYYVTRTSRRDNPHSTSILATDSTLKVTIDGESTFVTNAQGKISFAAPAPGKYFLFEYDVPKGYNLAKSPWLIEVAENYEVTVKAIDPNYYGKYTEGSTQSNSTTRNPLLVYNTWWTKSWYDGSQSNTTITNEPVTIKKVDENNQPLSGAIFSIWTVNYDDKGVGQIQRLQNLNETYGENAFTSDANGNIDISALYNHLTLEDDNDHTRFLLYEESAPEGYKRPKAPWLIAINENDLYDVTLWANGEPNTDFGDEWIPYNKYCNYTAYIRNTKDPGALYKKDAESLNTLLNGVKFDLYATTKKQNCYWDYYWSYGRQYKRYVCEDELDDGKHIVTKDYLIKGNIETGKDTDKGKIVFGNIILPDGYLLLYETSTIDGYIKEHTPWILVVENHQIKDIQKCKIPFQEPYVNYTDSTEWKLKDFETTGTKTYVTNHREYVLPKSGGMGTYWFMIIGMGMMTFAVTTLLTRKFEKKKL